MDYENYFIDLANRNSNEKHAREKYIERIMNEAEERSVGTKETKYTEKEKINTSRIKSMICLTAVLTGMISAYITHYITKTIIESNDIYIPITTELKNEINDKIDNYVKEMQYKGPKAIIDYFGHNPNDNGKPFFKYDYDKMATLIQIAAQKGETELRCIIKAMEEIVNDTYREETFNIVFNFIKYNIETDETLKSSISPEVLTLLSNGQANFLEQLEYNSWQEYHEKERKEIRYSVALNEAINSRRHK